MKFLSWLGTSVVGAACACACSSADGDANGSGGVAGAAGNGSSGSAGAAAAGAAGSAGTAGAAGAAGAPAGDNWSSYAASFFSDYCVECHAAGNPTRDYSTIADVKRDASIIRCGVAAEGLSDCGAWPPPKQFPIDNATASNPKPSDAERDRIVAWIEAGLPE